MSDLNRPRTFRLVRDEDPTGVSGTGAVADGVVWSDQTVNVRWRGRYPSIVHWREGMEAVEAIHGHDGRTRVEWDADRVVPPDLGEVRRILTTAQCGEVEGWDAPTMLDILWRLAKHVDPLLAEVARLRAELDPPPLVGSLLAQDGPPSEVETLRAASERFAQAAAAWRADGRQRTAEVHQYAADVLADWAANGRAPLRSGPETRAALADQHADSDSTNDN